MGCFGKITHFIIFLIRVVLEITNFMIVQEENKGVEDYYKKIFKY